MKKSILLLPLLFSIFHFQLPIFAQGSLTPPGAPAPTMKSLEQIEARTAISSVPFTISQSGSYYLTANITVAAGDAITIAANNVTLDLNGFTVRSTASPASGFAVNLGSGRANIAILNGFITGGVTNSGGVFDGPGFQWGIAHLGSPARNTRVTGVTVNGCLLGGIYLDRDSTVIQSCVVNTVGDTGLFAALVSDSTAVNCGAHGVYAEYAYSCRGFTLGSGYGIYSVNAHQCSGVSANGTGLSAANVANDCFGNCYAGSAAALIATSANNCVGSGLNGKGIQATTALNCYGYSFNNTGLDVDTAQNCYGYGGGFGDGVYASRTAQNCYGESTGNGDGVRANNAQNCYGESNGNGDGVSADTAENCTGISTSGWGINASGAQNCRGISNSSTGLRVESVASGCRGFSISGTGLSAFIANGCVGGSQTGTDLDVTHNVNSYSY